MSTAVTSRVKSGRESRVPAKLVIFMLFPDPEFQSHGSGSRAPPGIAPAPFTLMKIVNNNL